MCGMGAMLSEAVWDTVSSEQSFKSGWWRARLEVARY